MSTIVEPSNHRLDVARTFLLVVWGIAVAVALLSTPTAFAATQTDWQFNEVARTMNRIPYETLTAVVTGIRLALGGLMLATAGLLLWRRPQAGSLLAGVALTTLPFTSGLFGTAAGSGSWNELVGTLARVLAVAGAPALLALLFLFPDGRFYPARLRVIAIAGLLLTVTGIVAAEIIENGWWIFIIALLVTVLVGVGGQALRYRATGPEQRHQTIGFVVTVLAMPFYILSGILNVSPLLTLIIGYVLLAMLPLGLYSAARRGLWGDAASHRLFAGTAIALALVAFAAAGLWWRANQAETIDLAALESAEPVPVLLDADMAMDDIGALFYLIQHPAVDLRAITVNGVAFAHCDAGVRNALGLLEVARAPEIPVSCGRDEAFPGGTPAPDEWRASADNLYGAQVMTRGRTADPRPAAELLADTIRAAPGEIVVVAIGPLTNLAEAFQADPALAGQIKELIIMGGAVNVPGNVSDADSANRFAEWNFFADPVAADIVLASGAPITLVPLDATNDVPFTQGFYQRLRADALTRPAVFTYNLIYTNQWWLGGGMYWWDTLAAAVVTDPALVTFEEMALDVVTEEGSEMGRSIETTGGSPMRVATDADRQAFEALFLAVLNHE